MRYDYVYALSKEKRLDLKLLLSTFGLIFIGEFGDKSQLAVFTLVAKHGQPVPIFIGAAAALASVTLIGVVFGQGVASLVPESTLKRVAAVVFVVMGVLIWFDKV
jgi:putative Ca2+/H+ antiporter (TMEM165/GDT1 family)